MKKLNKDKLLKSVIAKIESTSLRVTNNNVKILFSEYPPNQKDEVFFALKELSGENLLDLDTVMAASDTNGIYTIRVTEYGLGYFSRKRAENISAIKNWSANLGVAFIGAVLGWLLSLLTMFLTGQITL